MLHTHSERRNSGTDLDKYSSNQKSTFAHIPKRFSQRKGRAGKLRSTQNHHSSLRPNWSCRAVVEVLVIAPAVPESPVGFVADGGVKIIRFGVLKLARFSRLKNSARN